MIQNFELFSVILILSKKGRQNERAKERCMIFHCQKIKMISFLRQKKNDEDVAQFCSKSQ